MVLDVLVSSLGFLSDLELLHGIMERRTRFLSLFCFVGGGPGSFLEISLVRVHCRSQMLPTGRLFISLVVCTNFVSRFDSTRFIDFSKSH